MPGDRGPGMTDAQAPRPAAAIRERPQPRGWVEIYPCDGGFDVYDWSEFHDSGHRVGSCRTRGEALSVARRWARENNRKLPQARIIPFGRDASA